MPRADFNALVFKQVIGLEHGEEQQSLTFVCGLSWMATMREHPHNPEWTELYVDVDGMDNPVIIEEPIGRVIARVNFALSGNKVKAGPRPTEEAPKPDEGD